jgi:V8-like Glu-specific endopeptidase
MILLGKTESLREKKREEILKKLKLTQLVFLILFLFPIALFVLFGFNILAIKPYFDSDLQQPVAMLVNGTDIGTAFLISPTKMLTARHVVEKKKIGESVQVIFEKTKTRKEVTARILYYPTTDIMVTDNKVTMDYFLSDFAVLEVPEIKDILPIELGNSDEVVELDDVILVGYPGADYSISQGNINSLTFKELNLFKLDATSNPGNSGGPCILKNNKQVIGILVGGSGPDYQGENIALKINDVKKILENVKIVF